MCCNGSDLIQEALRRRSLLEEKQLPTNLYGQGDNYHPTNSHVLPALIRR